jgi:transcriptional regulator with XRE-family HTH domain
MTDHSGLYESVCVDSFDASMREVGVRLKLLREACGYSQRELAKRAGLTNSSISIIEQGQVSPSVQSLGRILAALPISISDFFAFTLPQPGATTVVNHIGSQLDARVEELLPAQVTPFIAQPMDVSGVVTEGEVLLINLAQQLRLTAGARFYIPARQCYRFANSSANPATIFYCSIFAHKS